MSFQVAGVVPDSLNKLLFAPEAQEFLVALHRAFKDRRASLLKAREERQVRVTQGEHPCFLSETEKIRRARWKIRPAPSDLQNRRVEITGPVEAKMMINALNSGAQVFMADFEDSLSPTWNNIIEGQQNLFKAVRKTLNYTSPEGKSYRLNEHTATLFVRPRGWHLIEENLRVDGEPMPASLVDFGLYFFHNVDELCARNTGPYFYLPKLENRLEARLWADVFKFAETHLGLPDGTIRATVLIETIFAVFEMDEILFELKNHICALNAGRWDYLFSIIKKFQGDRQFIWPDRSQLTMTVPFMRAYSDLLVQTCHRRGAHAMGGMAAFIPSRKNADVNRVAFEKVREDKEREARAGFDGTWVAHPDLVPVAEDVFDRFLGGRANQLENLRPDVRVKASELLDFEIEDGKVTEAGMRNNISVALQYVSSWLNGSGAVGIFNLMEDTATAEISRAQLWQWIHHRAKLDDGREVTSELYETLKAQEFKKLHGERSPFLIEAVDLLDRLVLSERFENFLTSLAYPALSSQPDFRAPPIKGPAYDEVSMNLREKWSSDPRWRGIRRDYTAEEVMKLRPSVLVQHTLAERGAQRLWSLLNTEKFINSMGALTGAQAVQMVKGGLKALYLSGWQVAGDANLSGQTYPDQSLYPSNSVPTLVRRLNNALMRADQIHNVEGENNLDWYAPIVADAEAGFGGPLHAFELMKSMIEAGAAAVHFEDQLAAEKKCGHLGGKVLIPTSQFIKILTAARLAADVLDVPTLIIARTDALAATLLTSDVDPADRPFLTGERTAEGYFRVRPGIRSVIARGLAYAPYADMLWFETSKPDLDEALEFARAIHAIYPDKPLAYNCSPSFNWSKHLDEHTIATFQTRLASFGYKFQFITLAGWHAVNYHTFELARRYTESGMSAYVALQQCEFDREELGYTGTRHQREVGTGYFDQVLMTVTRGQSSTTALEHSTEAQQFTKEDRAENRRRMGATPIPISVDPNEIEITPTVH